jgi:tetratricopeptide (TPR) repeat protein
MRVFRKPLRGKFIIVTFLLIFFLANSESWAQSHFKYDLKTANPVDEKSTLPIKVKIKIHESYLNKAISGKETAKEFYGHLFLFVDFYKDQNYVAVTKHLLQADSIAELSGNKSWLGAIYMRKGTMSDAVSHNYEESIINYKMAVKLCTEAGDSLCIAESLEQISSMYGFLEKYDTADKYFTMALPLLKKFADKQEMALAYNNYSNLLSFKQHFSEAILYVDSAVNMARDNNDTYKEMMYMNNMASDYADVGQYDKAIGIYQNCLGINEKNKWADRRINNYNGLVEAFEKKGDYRHAFEYLKAFYLLNDSLRGQEVQLKIAELNAKYEPESKELIIEKDQQKLMRINQSLAKRNFLIILIALLVIMGVFFWQWQVLKTKFKLRQNRESLSGLTKMLLEKNTVILELEEKLVSHIGTNDQSTDSKDLENLSNQRILTDADWTSFKTQFEKAYPEYLFRLRAVFPNLSSAEERLFLLIKLKLKTKEKAAILGISVDSVKKARFRLRKRINLTEDVQLDNFIHDF